MDASCILQADLFQADCSTSRAHMFYFKPLYAPENDCRFTVCCSACKPSATYIRRREIKATSRFEPGSPAWKTGMLTARPNERGLHVAGMLPGII